MIEYLCKKTLRLGSLTAAIIPGLVYHGILQAYASDDKKLTRREAIKSVADDLYHEHF